MKISNQDFHKHSSREDRRAEASAFLSSELPASRPQDALFHIIPAPLENSVSYGTGTAKAPEAVIRASSQLELWDGFSIPAEEGIFTSSWLDNPETGKSLNAPELFLMRLEAEAAKTLEAGSIPVIIGGEHTVSLAAFRALKNLRIEAGIIQFDAHADLREEYEGSKLSHACVMKRAFEMGYSLFQAGVRSLSCEEVLFREKNSILFLDAFKAVPENISRIDLPDNFPENIYITIDVDGFDPSVFPGTGTPEPGGLGWYQTLKMIESLASSRNIIGFDVVEVSPVEGTNISEFSAARLIYNVMGIVSRSRKKRIIKIL